MRNPVFDQAMRHPGLRRRMTQTRAADQLAVRQPQHRRRAEDRRRGQDRRRAVGRAGRPALHDHLDARARGRALSWRRHQRQDRPPDARRRGRRLARAPRAIGAKDDDDVLPVQAAGTSGDDAGGHARPERQAGRGAPACRSKRPTRCACIRTGGCWSVPGRKSLALGRMGRRAEIWATFDAPVTALCASAGRSCRGRSRGRAAAPFSMRSGQRVDGWALPADVPRRSSTASSVPRTNCCSSTAAMAPDARRACAGDLGRGVARPGPVAAAASGEIACRSLPGLHCPMGICLDGHGDRARLAARARGDRRCSPARSASPAIPAISAASGGPAAGYAMACLSRRDPLIEFLKTERAFVAEMKATIEPRHWIAPRAIRSSATTSRSSSARRACSARSSRGRRPSPTAC